jgi:hypothetical protein
MLLLAFAVFGGTAPWTVHLIASYAVATYACDDAGALLILHGLTLVAGLVAAAAVLVSIRILRQATRLPAGERTFEDDRDQFLASGGVLLGGLGLMAIAFGEIGVVIVGCGS